MHPSNPHRHNPNSVVLTDSKAKAIPIFGAVWTVLALSGMGLLLIGSFVLATILFVAAIGSAFWLLPRAVSFLQLKLPATRLEPTLEPKLQPCFNTHLLPADEARSMGSKHQFYYKSPQTLEARHLTFQIIKWLGE